MSVEPEVGERFAGDHARYDTGFPLRHAKVERPLLPPDTLGRNRLLAWLDAHIDRRVLYLVAEAGFGKTTLIADYARRSRLRTFWYRLDEDDTDGLAFLRYVVAACQAVDSGLLLRTSALLNEPSIEPLRSDAIATVMLSEIEPLGEIPSLLVLDDFHMVESIPSITTIVERLIERIPDGLTIAIATRHEPPLSVAALRSRCQLAELDREDLRFNEQETEQLFREAYRLPLEADVLRDLNARTDGWAASLQLVKTAIENRTPAQTRAFIHSLNGAEGDLYDYLAEEVVGELDPDLRDFLLRSSLLEELDPAICAVAGDVTSQRARFLLGRAEHLGLLSRSEGIVGAWRAHPLVREFLLARLELELGPDRVIDLHRLLAAALEPHSWRLSARQWAAAGDAHDVRRVICAALPTIVGSGDCGAAEDLIIAFPDPAPNPWYDIIQSRQLMSKGRPSEAHDLACRAAKAACFVAPGDRDLQGANALNFLYLGIQTNDRSLWIPAAKTLAQSEDVELAAIGRAAILMEASGDDGGLDEAARVLRETAEINHARSHRRHEGVSLLNLSAIEVCRANPWAVIQAGNAALAILEQVGDSADIASAKVNLARGLAMLGDPRWRSLVCDVVETRDIRTDPEALIEIVELEACYGDPQIAKNLLGQLLGQLADRPSPSLRLISERLHVRLGGVETAGGTESDEQERSLVPTFLRAREAFELHRRALEDPGSPGISHQFESAIRTAEKQQAWYWVKYIKLTSQLVGSPDRLNGHVHGLQPPDDSFLSVQAELVLRRLADLDAQSIKILEAEATKRPERWRYALRPVISDPATPPAIARPAAALLERIGDPGDLGALRTLAKNKSLGIPEAGVALAKRLAAPVVVDDLGRVMIHIGDRSVVGTAVRHKVLSLLVYLLTRPHFSATREQVVEALWPEMDPDQATNSLNQTAYFLRQVFEAKSTQEVSAGYVGSSSDLIWLDSDLVASRSARCVALISACRRGESPELVTQLAEVYTHKFAMDFLYDEWASAFRDSLHAAYLDQMERSIVADTKRGNFERALLLAHHAMSADPEAETIELCLLRLYRLTGAHAAAAEQYSHYAAVLRDQLGIEPPPLEQI